MRKWDMNKMMIAATFALAGCSGSPQPSPDTCNALNSFDLSKQVGSCSGIQGATVVTHTQCEQDLMGCSAADQTILSSIFTCEQALTACVPGAEIAFQAALNACVTQASGLTSGCAKSFSFPVTSGPDGGTPSLCQALASFSLGSRAAACTSLQVPSLTQAQCQQDLSSCSPADQAVLTSIFTCQAALAACAPGQEAAFARALDACSQQALTLSPACAGAFSFPTLAITTPVPNNQIGTAPAAAVFNGKLYVAYRANDASNTLFLTSSSDGTTFPSGTAFNNIKIGSAPALAVFNNKLYVAFKSNTDTSLFLASSADGTTFSAATQLAGNQTGNTPAMAVFNGKLYIAYQGTDANHFLTLTSSSDGTTFATATVAMNEHVSIAPALAVFNNKLYVAFKNNGDNNLYLASSADGTTFPAATQLSPNQTTMAPALSVSNNRLVIAYQSADGNQELEVISSSDGAQFTTAASAHTGMKVGSTPALVVFGGQLEAAFQASDATHALYVTQGL